MSTKLSKTKIELDETDTKLFPKKEKAKSNFGKTIYGDLRDKSKEEQTKVFLKAARGANKRQANLEKEYNKIILTKGKDKRIIEAGVKKQISTKRVSGRKADMQKTIKAQKYAALVALAAGSIYGITRYSQDMVIVIAGTLLVALLVEKSLKD